MTYEELQDEACKKGINIIEGYHFNSDRIDALYCDSNVALSKALENSTQKACILAEEIAHHDSAVGNIIDQSLTSNRKQELKGRLLAYNKMIGLLGIVDAYNHHCLDKFEMAEYLGVTDEFLSDALDCYHSKYGRYAKVDNYIICFEPSIGVLELI